MPDFGPFIVAGASLGAVYSLSGVGMVVLYRATGTLNLAHGALGATSALIAWELNDQRGWPVAAAVVVGLASSTVVAMLYAAVVARRLNETPPMTQAAATLGLTLAILGALNWRWADIPRRLRLPSDTWGFEVIGVRVTGTRLVAVALALAITGGVATLLQRTRLGLQMRALADDRHVSGQIGVPVGRVTVWAWLVAGVVAGLTGLLLGNLSRLDAPFLTFLVIPALAAAVCGKLRSLAGTVAAGIVMGLLEAVATPIDGISDYRAVMPYLIGLLVVFWFARSPARTLR